MREVLRVGRLVVENLVEVDGRRIPFEEATEEIRRRVGLAIYRGAAEVLAPPGVKVEVRLVEKKVPAGVRG